MLFLKKILARWVSDAYEADLRQDQYANEKMYKIPNEGTGIRGVGADFKNPLNITLYNALGGRIIKFHSYSNTNDARNETTYIVPDKDDFEKALGKFIAIEALKHTDE
jgi:hypothetical protein